MTQLEYTSANILDSTPVQSISRGLLYYVYTGRNAWHSTWATRYADGCMHITVESAKAYAEDRRVRGTVFYIQQLPCLIFRAKKLCVLVTEINNRNPLSGYSVYATTSEVESGYRKISGAMDDYLKVGAPVNGVAMSFLPNSRFWKTRPGPIDSTVILLCRNPSQKIERVNSDKLFLYKSYSNGGGYYLGWNEISSDTKRFGVLELCRIAKSRKF